MPKRGSYEEQARAAAQRIEDARALGQQLTFLPDSDGQGGEMVAEAARGPGRPKGSKNRIDSQLRAMLAAQGMKMPEQQLAEIAGLSSRDDVMISAMADAERVLAWAGGQHPGDYQASVAQRLATFVELFKARIRAAEALLPYGLGKITPDVTQNVQAVQIVMPQTSAPVAAGQVIEGHRQHVHAPPPMPNKIQQKQDVTNVAAAQSDKESRTE